ncbi:MAG TPA: hypothetical protein VMG12_27610 [Polyangiaceae bacterium]|nr:hypothetical protein [Polyangiaceae bacterium]
MSSHDFVAQCLYQRNLARGLWLALLSIGCIDTSLDSASLGTACPVAGDALANVVFIQVDLGDLGVIRCSGVALTSTVIATALGCVMVPNEVSERYGIAHSTPSGDVFNAGAPEEDDCTEENAIEDGSFSSQYGPPLPREAIYVGLIEGDDQDISVTEVVRAVAARCSGGLALLKLSSRLTSKPIPIRFNAGRDPDEPVILSYVSVRSNDTLERNDVSTTLSDGDRLPRSLGASATCPEQGGGGVFSSQTGALLGVVDRSFGNDDCSSPARGSAVRLAAYQHMLVDVAGPGALLAEPGSENASIISCLE